ncbi:MAG: divalent-cation tolerance protein CutA [Pseudomonadales bacterium]
MTIAVDSSFCVVLTTTSSRAEAEQLAKLLVEQKLAACVQLLPIDSIYTWENTVKQDSEVLMLIKTSKASFVSIEMLIQQHHSYQVPEIIQLPIEQGSSAYLQWLADAVSKKTLT